jgi:hypothetical protein
MSHPQQRICAWRVWLVRSRGSSRVLLISFRSLAQSTLLPVAAPALRPVPEELQAVWLPNAKLLHGGKVLQLAANTSFLGKRDLGQKMMVRECYVRLCEKLEEDFRAGEKGRVIIGTPGESGV